jgi:hypothetical protein
VLDKDLYESQEVQDLKAKGHPVDLAESTEGCASCGDKSPGYLSDYDLILGRKAWYCDTKHLKYLEKIAIPAVRKRADYQKEKLKDAA